MSAYDYFKGRVLSPVEKGQHSKPSAKKAAEILNSANMITLVFPTGGKITNRRR